MSTNYNVTSDGKNLVASADSINASEGFGGRVFHVNSSTPAREGIYEPTITEGRAHDAIHNALSIHRRAEQLRGYAEFELPDGRGDDPNVAALAGSMTEAEPETNGKLTLSAQALRYIQETPGLADVVKTNLALGVNPQFNEAAVDDAARRNEINGGFVSHLEDEIYGVDEDEDYCEECGGYCDYCDECGGCCDGDCDEDYAPSYCDCLCDECSCEIADCDCECCEGTCDCGDEEEGDEDEEVTVLVFFPRG